MTDTQTRGGLSGDPAPALTTAGTGGCCGHPPRATLSPPDPAAAPAAPCCGTASDAAAEGSCCGSAAKVDAVASGQGCCG
ncbi:hypothetical protein DMB66_03960 [Actinoplanes sp. ATCC 53533]|uniref:hypothetical protein n=1 Tax=Actinoplanes sp. ATCC 53533 TaxID=1288362 RepID=UPI000F773308|nr:hypothetical protein [Actinoplanes sp. ATCC 53533]RSM73188.1 hypothetical protein DMB66_03960 [Actinoplanes sp. ATCC 53533]